MNTFKCSQPEQQLKYNIHIVEYYQFQNANVGIKFLLFLYLGVSSGRSSDDSFQNNSSSVLSAAQHLAIELQKSGYCQPDPITADIINTWLENYLPVSDA